MSAAVYVAVPVAMLTREWLSSSMTPDLDHVRVTAEGRVVLRFRGEVPDDLARRRYTTRDADSMRAWIPEEPSDATQREARSAEVAAMRDGIRARWGLS